jgi:hypothetical protein
MYTRGFMSKSKTRITQILIILCVKSLINATFILSLFLSFLFLFFSFFVHNLLYLKNMNNDICIFFHSGNIHTYIHTWLIFSQKKKSIEAILFQISQMTRNILNIINKKKKKKNYRDIISYVYFFIYIYLMDFTRLLKRCEVTFDHRFCS